MIIKLKMARKYNNNNSSNSDDDDDYDTKTFIIRKCFCMAGLRAWSFARTQNRLGQML
jgi:hypothetical protein